MHVDLYVATVMKLAALMRLTAGIYAIQAPGVPMTVEKAAQYAVAATVHGTRAGIDPYELVGIARNESDFIETMVGPDGKDCGLTQTRITITKYTLSPAAPVLLAGVPGSGARDEGVQRRRARATRTSIAAGSTTTTRACATPSTVSTAPIGCGSSASPHAARRGITVGQSCRRVRSHGDIARALHRGIPRTRDLVATATARPAT